MVMETRGRTYTQCFAGYSISPPSHLRDCTWFAWSAPCRIGLFEPGDSRRWRQVEEAAALLWYYARGTNGVTNEMRYARIAPTAFIGQFNLKKKNLLFYFLSLGIAL